MPQAAARRQGVNFRRDSLVVVIYEPMSRRLVVSSAVTGGILFVAGLIVRPANITVAVVLFLVAVAVLGLAGYGVLDRLIDRRKRSRTTS